MTEPFCEDDRVYLRPVERTDAPLLAKWKNDPVVRKMALGPAIEISAENQEEDICGAVAADDQLYLVLSIKETEEPIGYIRIDWKDDARRFAWLRFALGAQRGKGYAKEGVGRLLDHLFERGMHRVDAEVYEFNHPCIGLLKRIGFKEEGVKRQAHFDGEKYWNILAFGLLRHDLADGA